MTSKSIYQPLSKPTYLYIKQHSITKLKYFGKTSIQNPYKYNGSGVYWTKHIKKHGQEHIDTLWVSDLYYDTSIVDVALQFSFENNIVESTEWANLIMENGLDGSPPGAKRSEESKVKQSARQKGVSRGKGISRNKGVPKSEEHKSKQSTSTKGVPKKPQSEETKAKRSAALTGIPRSEETKSKLRVPKPEFFSIIETRKTYNIQGLSRYYPEFKQHF
jgi:hypothetical protein